MALKKSTKDPLWNNIFQQGFCEKSEDPWKIYSKSKKKVLLEFQIPWSKSDYFYIFHFYFKNIMIEISL